MSLRETVKQALRMCGHALVSTVHDRLDGIEEQLNTRLGDLEIAVEALAESQTSLLQASIETARFMRRQQPPIVVSAPAETGPLCAARELLDYLYSYLPGRAALVQGSSDLLSARFEIVAQAGPDVGVALFDSSWGPEESPPAPLVVIEWRESFEGLPARMRELGYWWQLVLYRKRDESGEPSFYANDDRTPPEAHGHVFFFREASLFQQAQAWCAAVLPRTFFST